MGPESVDPRWLARSLGHRLAAVVLLVWPASARRRDGPSLLDAVDEELRSAARRGLLELVRCTVAECASVLASGLSLRVDQAGDLVRRTIRGVAAEALAWRDDLRIAARGLLRNPGFTLVAVCTLAIGIGANAAIYQLVDRVLIRPPAYERPDELILVWGSRRGSAERVPIQAPDAGVLAERATTLASVAFTGRPTDGALGPAGGVHPQHVVVADVTPDFFRVLGVPVARGRGFLDQSGVGASSPEGEVQASAVLISDDTWHRVFDGDPSVPGRTARLDGRPVTILGVMPSSFRLELPPSAGVATDVDVWVPIEVPLVSLARPNGRLIDQDSDNSGAVVGRLAPGGTLPSARDEAARIARQLRAEVPDHAASGFDLTVRPMHADATAHLRELLVALLAGAAAVLLVAYLSLSALLLARGLSREREVAVRGTLGAGPGRIARGLWSESLLLLALGGALAPWVAVAIDWALTRLVTPDIAWLAHASRPGSAVVPILAATTVGALLFGGIAVLQAGASLRSGGRGLVRSQPARGRGREALIVVEVAVSVVLVLGATLLFRTADELRRVDLGFDPDSAVAFNVSFRAAGERRGPAERARLARSVEEAVRTLPGVEAVGLTGALPLSGRRWSQPYGLAGQTLSEWSAQRADFRVVTSGYFAAIGTRLLEGRSFTSDEDLDERERVVVVDRSLARRLAPHGSALGSVIGIPLDGEPVQARVVGVVEPVRQKDLLTPARETVYVPYRQEASRNVSFVVRTTVALREMALSIRPAVLGVDQGLAVYGMRPLSDYVRSQTGPTRFGYVLLTAYGLLCLLSAALGLYGVVAWEVGRRRHELGVRMAIGATSSRIRAAVLLDGARLAAMGTLGGTALAALTAPLLNRLLYGVSLFDPWTWVGAMALVGSVTLLACWMPARSASRLDPGQALRSD